MPTNDNINATLSARVYAEIWEAHLEKGILCLPLQSAKTTDAPRPPGQYSSVKWRKAVRDGGFERDLRKKGLPVLKSWAQAAEYTRSLLPSGSGLFEWSYGILAESALPDSALMILDVDMPDHPTVVQMWERLAAVGVPPSRTSVRTAKGAHYYWRVPRGGKDLNAQSDGQGSKRAYDVRLDGFAVGPGSRVFRKKYGRVIHYEPLLDGQPAPTLAEWVHQIPVLDEAAYTAALSALDMTPAKPQKGRVARARKAVVNDDKHPKVVTVDTPVTIDGDGGVLTLEELVSEAQAQGGNSRKFPCPFCGSGFTPNAHVHRTALDDSFLYCFKSSCQVGLTMPKRQSNAPPLERVEDVPVSALIDGRYLPDFKLEKKVTFIKAHKGAGKSTWCARRLRELRQTTPGDGPQIVSITLRRTLARQLASDLGVACYLDLQKLKASTDGDIVVCYDSLASRCKPHDRGYILVLDEVAQLLPYVVAGGADPDRKGPKNSSTLPARLNWDRFVEMLRGATRVIAMDADLDEETIEMLRYLAPETFADDNYQYLRVEDPRLLRDIIYDSRQALLYSMWRDVMAGRRIAVACSTVEDADALTVWIEQLGAYRRCATPWSQRGYTGVNAGPLRVTLATGHLRDLYPDPLQATQDCDVLIYTGTWGTGVDLPQRNHWHRVYGLFDAEVASAQSASQHLGRVRYPIETTRLIHIRNNGDRPLRDLTKLREAAQLLVEGLLRYTRSNLLLRNAAGGETPHSAEHAELCARVAAREAEGGRLGRLREAYEDMYSATRAEWTLDARREAASESGFGPTAAGWKQLAKHVISGQWRAVVAGLKEQWQEAVAASDSPIGPPEATRAYERAKAAVRTRKKIEEILPALAVPGGLLSVPRSTLRTLVEWGGIWGRRVKRLHSVSLAAFALGEVLGNPATGEYLDDMAALERMMDARIPGHRPSRIARARLVVGLLRYGASNGKFATDHRGQLRLTWGLMQHYLTISKHKRAAGGRGLNKLTRLVRLFSDHGIKLARAPGQGKDTVDSTVFLTTSPWLPTLAGTPITLGVVQQVPLRRLLAESCYLLAEQEISKYRSTTP